MLASPHNLIAESDDHPRRRMPRALLRSGADTTTKSRQTVRIPLALSVPALAVSLLLLVPVVYLVIRAADSGGEIWPLIFRERTATIAWNTVRLAAGVAISTAIIAVPLAWLTTRTDLPWARFWDVVAPLPLAIPSYAGAIAVIGSLGPRGIVQGWLEPLGVETLPSVYGYVGSWTILTLFTYPYVYLAVRAALRGLDPSMEEASRGLGRNPLQTFFMCTLPQLRPALGSALLLVSLYTISDFGVVTLMRYEAFTRGIYTQYRAAFDRTLAAALGVMLVMFAIGLLLGENRLRRRATFYRLGSGAARTTRIIRLGRARWLAFAFCALLTFLALGVPVGTFLYWLLTGTSAGSGLGRLPGAAWNSIVVSVGSAAGALLAALPIALLAVRYRSRFSTAIERLSYLGYGLPGIVIALSFVFIGARYLTPLYQTLGFMILAIVIRLLPQGVGSVRASLLQVSPRLEEASRTLGKSFVATFVRVTLPLAWPGIAIGGLLVSLSAMKELPIALLLSPTGYDTLATEIWSATEGGAYGRAAAPALLLIVVSAIPTLLLGIRRVPAPERIGD